MIYPKPYSIYLRGTVRNRHTDHHPCGSEVRFGEWKVQLLTVLGRDKGIQSL